MPSEKPWYKNRIILLMASYFFIRSIRLDTSYTQEYLRLLDLNTRSANHTDKPYSLLGPAYIGNVQGKTQLFQLLFFVFIVLVSPQIGLKLSLALDLGSFFCYLVLKESLYFRRCRTIGVLEAASCFLGISLGTSNLIHSQIYSLISENEYHQVIGLTRSAGTLGHMLGSACGGLFVGVLFSKMRYFTDNIAKYTMKGGTYEAVMASAFQQTWHSLLNVHFAIIASSIFFTIFSFCICVFVMNISKNSIVEKKVSKKLVNNLNGTVQGFSNPRVLFMSIIWSINLLCLLLVRVWSGSLWTSHQVRLGKSPMNGFASFLSHIMSFIGSVTPSLLLRKFTVKKLFVTLTFLFFFGGLLSILLSTKQNSIDFYYIAHAFLDYTTWTSGAFLGSELAKLISKEYIKPFYSLLYICIYSCRMMLIWYMNGLGKCPSISLSGRYLIIGIFLVCAGVINIAVIPEEDLTLPHK